MSKGYLVLAQNSGNDDYIRMAYALALSIRNTQSTVKNVTLAIEEGVDIPGKYSRIFDSIVIIPWSDNAAGSAWKIENKWKYYYMTPYDETVILDADMLFPKDISHWWDLLSSKDMWFTTTPRTFKGSIITSTKYRQTFVSNQLPNIYTAFAYFKKNQTTGELFRLANYIFNNWETFFYTFLDETRPKFLSGDVAYALAVKILGIENECTGQLEIPSFVHMKSHLQGIEERFLTEDWTKHIPTYFADDGSFKIGNYEQTLPFHYHIKSWLTDEMIRTLEKKAGL